MYDIIYRYIFKYIFLTWIFGEMQLAGKVNV